ncbi:excisionase family DNA-binding protein [Rothia mucilaginosa]|uniref:excisionase family DNA-binding protein n=1 Tax=Rothia mucilaginosa TaxID=43675 RepID=UPI00288C05C8|nr:excisionase family DNA-binding protein [Rothia mucilaginosa]
MPNTQLLQEETLNQAQTEAKKLLGNSNETAVTLTVSGNESQEIGDALSQVIQQVLHALAQGQRIEIQTSPQYLTTTMAARRIGISRPTLMKAIRSGELPAFKVGSHFRIRTGDAEVFRKTLLEKTIAQKEQALKDLWKFEEENNLNDIIGGPAW